MGRNSGIGLVRGRGIIGRTIFYSQPDGGGVLEVAKVKREAGAKVSK